MRGLTRELGVSLKVAKVYGVRVPSESCVTGTDDARNAPYGRRNPFRSEMRDVRRRKVDVTDDAER